MKRFQYILIAALFALAGCIPMEEFGIKPEQATEGERVTITFNVAIPEEDAATKAMGNTPSIDPDRFYVAVFGGSGYFNEWAKATVVAATANYDGTNNTKYTLKVSLAVSDSRLRVHFIANSPVTTPPIAGSQDNEENVLSKIRSHRESTLSDGYWQKIILPNGVKAVKNDQDVWEATPETLAQFPDPIVLVRNFARIYLRNLTRIVNGNQEVVIKKFGLAYAPAEGVIAPILEVPYTSNAVGAPMSIDVDDENDDTVFYYENFFINYQNYPLISTSTESTVPSVMGDPFNYAGYSPDDQSYNYYTGAGHTDVGVPSDGDLQTFDSAHPENNVLFVYERTMPSAARRATRLIIKAERFDYTDPLNPVSEGDKYYALDIVNTEGQSIPLLRNQSYTIHLLNIEAGTGESDINKASSATSATVTGDPNYQQLINISDGKSSIGTSFTEKFYVQPQEDYVMFRYIPTNITDDHYSANQEGNELVTIQVGSYNLGNGVFTKLTPAEASSAGILTFKTEGSDYKVQIVKDNSNKAISYVRKNNQWIEATTDEIADSNIEKWGMITFELNESYKDEDNYFTQERTMAIHVTGSYDGREISRNVVIKTSPRQEMIATCMQKYVPEVVGEQEVLRVKIPTGLSRSVFPLEFKVEPNGYTLTPNGDVLPVSYGASIDPANQGPAFYFIKTITQDQYDALGTVTENGKTWKVFDCNFKTTLAHSECTIYVKNKYFTDAQAYDAFYNYTQRLFTWTTTPSTATRHGNTTFTFVMDQAHNNNTVVWWDPTNALNQSADAATARTKGLSTSNRVLPPIMTITLNGFTPQYREDGETPVTSGLVHSSGNTYLYYVGTGTPTSDMATVNLALTVTGAIGSSGSVTLSTANITEAPLLYATNTSSLVTIQGAAFSNVGFYNNATSINLGLNRTTTFHFSYVDGLVQPITVTMEGLTLDGNTGTNALFTNNGDGTYTFTPTEPSVSTYTFSVKTTSRFSSCSITLSGDEYESVTKTLTRPTSFVIPSGSLRVSSNRPYDNGTYVNTYYTNNYTDTYLISGSNSYNNRTYRTRFTNNNTASSRDDVTVDLTKYGNNVETGVAYFYYNARGVNDSWGTTRNYYATATLANLYDHIIQNSGSESISFSTTRP